MQRSEKLSPHGGEHRAAAVQPPVPTRGLELEREEFRRYRVEREGIERRSMVRGLILLAVLALVGSIARAGLGRVFVHGWWRVRLPACRGLCRRRTPSWYR